VSLSDLIVSKAGELLRVDEGGMAKGELPTISGDPANPPLLTTKNGGFGG